MIQFWFGILIIAIAAAMGWWGTQLASEGWKNWKHPALSSEKAVSDVFRLMVSSTMRFKYPGQLLYLYDSQLGKTISPVCLALFLAVVNNKSSISQVYSFETKALMRYDEGGKTQIDAESPSAYKFSYIPAGKTVERWRILHSVGFLHDQIYFVPNNDWTKCKRLDFSKSSFELEACNKQLQPGESLNGWVFYEMEEDVRTQLPEIKQLEFTIKNAAGEAQITKIDYPKEGETFPLISSGSWDIQAGYYDLTKQKFTLCPRIDFQTILKEGKGR